jgi:hypothetical protein
MGLCGKAAEALFYVPETGIILQPFYSNSHKDFPKSGEALGQTRASAAHNSEIVYENRYKILSL